VPSPPRLLPLQAPRRWRHPGRGARHGALRPSGGGQRPAAASPPPRGPCPPRLRAPFDRAKNDEIAPAARTCAQRPTKAAVEAWCLRFAAPSVWERPAAGLANRAA